jgi:hypothetical protein
MQHKFFGAAIIKAQNSGVNQEKTSERINPRLRRQRQFCPGTGAGAQLSLPGEISFRIGSRLQIALRRSNVVNE